MIACTIDSTGLLSNEAPDAASNPWECQQFKYQTLYTDGPPIIFGGHIEWFLTGYVPNDLKIDKESGLISGIIKPLTSEQPSVVDFYPDEIMKEDGSNWMNTGRCKNATHTFSLTIHRKFIEKIITPVPKEVITEVTSDVSIMVVKNNDIDNMVFCSKYLKAGYPLKIKNDMYTYETRDGFFKNHPSNFITCFSKE